LVSLRRKLGPPSTGHLSRRWAAFSLALIGAVGTASSAFALPGAAKDPDPVQTELDRLWAEQEATLARMQAVRDEEEAMLAKMRTDQEAALAELRTKQAELAREQARLAAQQAQLLAQQAQLAASDEAEKKRRDAEPAPGVALSLLGVPVHIFGNATLRYDYSVNSNLTESLTNGIQANWLLARIRFGAELGDKGPVIGGFRLSSGETPNPTVPFVVLSDAFRPGAFGIDQAWGSVRPLEDRDRLQLTFGRMKNPFWRGSVGTVRTQMVWDDDVNPAGAALTAQFYKSPSGSAPFRIENTVAYMQITSILDNAFVGLTGVVSGFGEQLRFLSKYVDGAISYYEWINLNTGLSVPTSQFASGFVSTQTATSAFLLSPGLQQTNTQVNYGPAGGAASAFLDPTFKTLNPTVQVHVPFKNEMAGDPDGYVILDYAHNFLPEHPLTVQGNLPTPSPATCASCTPVKTANTGPTNARRYDDGIGVTLGTRLGDKSYKSSFHPMNVWVTYRYVQSDAVLATFADSDLGAGSGYRGFALGTNYRIFQNLMAAVQYFDFMGFPLMENHVQRLFLDLMGDF
jgi:putative porin